MTGSAYFGEFKASCVSNLQSWGYDGICEPIREKAEYAYKAGESAAQWTKEATAPIVGAAKWTWEKTGEHYGAPAQAFLILVVIGIAYNLFGGGKKSKPKEDCRDALLRDLVREQMKKDPYYFQNQTAPAA